MEAQTTKLKKIYKQLERVSIADELADKLERLTVQANEALKGVATITRSDVINLILKRREPELSKVEIEDLKATHFDLFKYLTWLQSQAKTAKENGNDLTLKELLERSNDIIDGIKQRPLKRPTKTKASSVDNSSSVTSMVAASTAKNVE